MAEYAELVRFIGIIERGLARFETVKHNAIKQKNSDLRLKSEKLIAKWVAAKTKHLKSLNVNAGHGFSVKPVSFGKNGMMVTVSHPSMKKPVTRHLLRKNGIFTGRAPFGTEIFIEYKVTNAGDLAIAPIRLIHLDGTMEALPYAA